MEPVPDYQNYSREQLLDALQHINRERYPDNFVALTRALQNWKEKPVVPEPPLSQSKKILRFLFVVLPLGVLGIWLGGFGLFFVLFAFPLTGTRNDLEPWFSIVVGLVLLLVASLCLTPAFAYFLRDDK